MLRSGLDIAYTTFGLRNFLAGIGAPAPLRQLSFENSEQSSKIGYVN
jgi:hypothetical protein